MVKSKKERPDLNTPPVDSVNKETVIAAVNGVDSSAEIKLLNDKVVKMQGEIDGLKKQLNQIVTFIKQKIK